MNYACKEDIVTAFDLLTTYNVKMNTFLGFVCLWMNSTKINDRYIKANMYNFSIMVDKAFYLNPHGFNRRSNDEEWFVLFQDNWVEELSKKLKYKKIDSLSVALCFFWREPFDNTSELINKLKSYFSQEIYNEIFQDTDKTILFKNVEPVEPGELKQGLEDNIFESNTENFTVSLDDKKFIKKVAGDLTAAPFGQTLYANNWLKEVFTCFNFDFIQLYSLSLKNVKAPVTNETNILGENIIYYGAPGTGKSHEIEEKTNQKNSIRTVFHPETQYSDFVGCLKPSMGSSGIEYSFKHGPFIEALINAIKNPTNHYYLIIEEINRAPAAAVFGELFQLLDRDNDGQSKYTINLSDKDLLTLLNREIPSYLKDNKIYIPKNLSLYATMNSSDQAVMPLDTAFKRRWKFEYKPLNFAIYPIGKFELNTGDNIELVSWHIFAQVVNSILSTDAIPEDRHLGPWFVSENEISNSINAKKSLTGKILMYLWDDVLRHSERSILFHPEIKTFGALVKKVNNGELIFSNHFLKRLKEIESENPGSEVSKEYSDDS